MTSRTASISVGSFCLGAIVFLGVVVFLFFYLRPLVFLVDTKREFRNSPEIWRVPKPLVPAPTASPAARSKVVSYFGYQFDSPTPEVKEERKDENVVALSLSDCAGMAIFKPHANGRLSGLMQQGAPNAARLFEDLYGKEAVRSDYDFRRTVLNMTPKDLRHFASPRQIARNSVLLRLKGIGSQRFKYGLYSFETPTTHGFQEGNLSLDKGVMIEAYDHQDHLLTFVVGAKPGKGCFGQPELNSIIFSLRPIPASE
jgi:hypothetical protein